MAYQNILVPIDGSKTSHSAIKTAAELAKAFGSKVTAVFILTIDPFVGVEFLDTKGQAADMSNKAHHLSQEIIDEAHALFSKEGIEIETKIVEGQVIHKEIVKAAEETHADLVVMGSHGRTGIKKLMLGSVAQNVLGEIHIPVLIVRQ